MPWKSDKQRRWGNSPAGVKALGKKGVAEWNSASKGKKLTKKVKKMKSQYPSEVASLKKTRKNIKKMPKKMQKRVKEMTKGS